MKSKMGSSRDGTSGINRY